MRPVAVVTGGSGGIGRALQAELDRRGYDVADLSRSRGVDAADELQVDAAFAALPRVDVLINNAAVLIPRLLVDMTVAEWDATLASLRAAFLCSRAAFRRMGGGGSIINISSLAGVSGAEKFPRLSAYVAAKSGLAGFTEALAVEGRPLGIRVNAVSPGAVDTPMLKVAGVPGPALDPEAVARLAAWLASPESAPLTGANLRFDP